MQRIAVLALMLMGASVSLSQDSGPTIHAELRYVADGVEITSPTLPEIPDGSGGADLRCRLYLWADTPTRVAEVRLAFAVDELLPTRRVYWLAPRFQLYQSVWCEDYCFGADLDRGVRLSTYVTPPPLTTTPTRCAEFLLGRGATTAKQGAYAIYALPLCDWDERQSWESPGGSWVSPWPQAPPYEYQEIDARPLTFIVER